MHVMFDLLFSIVVVRREKGLIKIRIWLKKDKVFTSQFLIFCFNFSKTVQIENIPTFKTKSSDLCLNLSKLFPSLDKSLYFIWLFTENYSSFDFLWPLFEEFEMGLLFFFQEPKLHKYREMEFSFYFFYFPIFCLLPNLILDLKPQF